MTSRLQFAVPQEVMGPVGRPKERTAAHKSCEKGHKEVATPLSQDTATAPSASVPATTTVTTTTTTPAPAGTPVTAAPVATAIPRKPWEQSVQPTAPYAPAAQQITAAQPQQMQPQPRQGMRWTQMVLALGLLSAAGAGTVVVTKVGLKSVVVRDVGFLFRLVDELPICPVNLF